MPSTSKKQTKPKDGAKMAEKDPKWHALYLSLAEAAAHLTRGLINRTDLPADVIDVLKGILVLRETKDLFFAEGESLNPTSAMVWVEDLDAWAASLPLHTS